MAACMVFSPTRDLYSKQIYNKVIEHLGDVTFVKVNKPAQAHLGSLAPD